MLFELDGWRSCFLSIGAVEVYARFECFSRWAVEREPGSVEVMAGRWRMTIARASDVASMAQAHDQMREQAMADLPAEWEASQGPASGPSASC